MILIDTSAWIEFLRDTGSKPCLAVDALPPHIQEALPAVLRALTTVRLGEDAVTASPASLADVAGTPAKSALIDALIVARLLVSDENIDGQGIVRVAHEGRDRRQTRMADAGVDLRRVVQVAARAQGGEGS
jgi:hypothetical protein